MSLRFDFLGQHIRSFGGRIIIRPSKKNVQAFKAKIKAIFEEHKTVKHERLIAMLNPVIRGWANYHRTVSAKETFDSIDAWLWLKEWQWAKRRHPNKSARWIKAKYFAITSTSRWVFSARYRDAAAQWQTMTIVKASHTRRRWHTKIIGASNPFDPQWASYFQDRHDLKKVWASGCVLIIADFILSIWLSTLKAPVVDERLVGGLSRVRGNSHARFLGEDGPAMGRPYPTKRMTGGARRPTPQARPSIGTVFKLQVPYAVGRGLEIWQLRAAFPG